MLQQTFQLILEQIFIEYPAAWQPLYRIVQAYRSIRATQLFVIIWAPNLERSVKKEEENNIPLAIKWQDISMQYWRGKNVVKNLWTKTAIARSVRESNLKS